MICPAYQSAFIYDKDELRKKFSYFQYDTVPKVFTASKNKYLIAEQTTYKKKVRTMQTVPAKKVMVNVPDSLSGKPKPDTVITADLDRAARSILEEDTIVAAPETKVVTEDTTVYVISKDREVRVLKYNMPDSLVYDSVKNKYVAQKPKYYVDEVRFNTEQDSYMWYLRHSLVLPDVRLAKMQGERKDEDGGEEKKKPKEKRGLRGLFSKKEHDIDSAELDITPEGEEEFDFIDTTAQEEPEFEEQPKKKKGFLSGKKDRQDESVGDQPAGDRPKKRKKKKTAKPAEQPKDEKKKTEDEDDGF
ncbi:MAG TPA: hypothetical protein VEB86_03510 [Chryseosolibacter sp.]|nr:hypothetical protein [Chryseosolibacter sp.]